MKDHKVAFKLMGDLPPFMEKITESEFELSHEEQIGEYSRFCTEVINSKSIELLTGVVDVDRRLRETLFPFWWMLNKCDPRGKRGYDLWPSLYKIAKAWIVPALPKGVGSKSHNDSRNLLNRFVKLNKEISQIKDEVEKDPGFPMLLKEETMRGQGAFVTAKDLLERLVEQDRTSYFYEREGASEIFLSLGRKQGLKLIRMLFKVLPQVGIPFHENAKSYSARISKMKNRISTPLSTEMSIEEIEKILNEATARGLGP